MNSNWNLPPGCSESDIPGNSSFDDWLDDKLDDLWLDFEPKEHEDADTEFQNNTSFQDFVDSRWEDKNIPWNDERI